VIRLDPKHAGAHKTLGHILRAREDFNGAVVSFREAIRLDPGDTKIHHTLAWLLAAGPDGVRDGQLAVRHATRACELTGWKEPNYIDTLAAAYAEAGDFVKAVEYQKKALAFSAFEKKVGAEARQRLEQYARKTPYRDPAYARREPAPPPRPAK
jgi:Flp pilus assembly protein TadD